MDTSQFHNNISLEFKETLNIINTNNYNQKICDYKLSKFKYLLILKEKCYNKFNNKITNSEFEFSNQNEDKIQNCMEKLLSAHSYIYKINNL